MRAIYRRCTFVPLYLKVNNSELYYALCIARGAHPRGNEFAIPRTQEELTNRVCDPNDFANALIYFPVCQNNRRVFHNFHENFANDARARGARSTWKRPKWSRFLERAVKFSNITISGLYLILLGRGDVIAVRIAEPCDYYGRPVVVRDVLDSLSQSSSGHCRELTGHPGDDGASDHGDLRRDDSRLPLIRQSHLQSQRGRERERKRSLGCNDSRSAFITTLFAARALRTTSLHRHFHFSTRIAGRRLSRDAR